MDELIKVSVTYGTVEIVPTYRAEGDYVYYGGYSIHRNMYGLEVSRTEPTENFRVYFPPEPKKTLWQRLMDRM